MSTDASIEAVKAFLRRAKAAVSEGDVAAGTGLDVGTVKGALYSLMRGYRSSLAVREDGTLVYDFGAALIPLGERTLRDRAASLGRWLWKGFSWIYKASLAVMLVAYAVTFVVLIIAAAIAASAAAEDEGPAEGAALLVRAVFRSIFEFMTYQPILYSDTDRYGYRYAHFEPKAPVLPKRRPKEHEKSFIASVYDFVLGPARVEPHVRAQHQEVAAFVRKNRGVLTVRDVQQLSGMSRTEAERFFATFVAEQDGVADVTDDGALYATFEELLRSKSTKHDAPIVFYWDEYEAPFELTGNTTGNNALVALLAAFNLLCSFYVMSGVEALGNAGVWLGAVPAVIFSLFFAVPLLRAPVLWWRNKLQHVHNIRKRIFRAIFGSSDQQLAASDIIERANEKATTEEKLRIADVGSLLDETLLDVSGEQDVNDRGELVADMTRLRIEAQAVEEHALEQEESAVVFRTN